MAATLKAIREGLAANLAVLNGVQISPYVLSNPQTPHIWIRPGEDDVVSYHLAMQNGLEDWHMMIEAFTGSPFAESAQMKLDELAASTGPTSLKAAVEADTTLGGVALDLVVTNAHGYAQYQRPDGNAVLGC